MAKVTYRHGNGSVAVYDIEPGRSVMQGALANGVAGIIAECGGQLMCATCHVYVADAGAALPEMSDDERDMLELAAAPVDERSRLSCQLRITDEVGDVEVILPETQL
jgi:2Fe-2S ferredoxin